MDAEANDLGQHSSTWVPSQGTSPPLPGKSHPATDGMALRAQHSRGELAPRWSSTQACAGSSSEELSSSNIHGLQKKQAEKSVH